MSLPAGHTRAMGTVTKSRNSWTHGILPRLDRRRPEPTGDAVNVISGNYIVARTNTFDLSRRGVYTIRSVLSCCLSCVLVVHKGLSPRS
jgi:hypothetical protein